jgi:hypothetical protein
VQADIPPEQRGIGDGARTQQRVDRPDPVGAAIKRRGTPERGNASKRVVRVDAKPVALPCQNGELAQAAINQHQIVIAAEIAVVSPDFGHLAPMVAAARRELEAIGIRELPKVVVADSGYWHTEQMHQLAADGIPVLIAPESGLRTTPRPGWRGGYFSFMRNILQTQHGAGLYTQRQHLIETLFGAIKHNRGIVRFHRRGRAAVRTEWRLITATYNLAKLHKHQLAAAAT